MKKILAIALALVMVLAMVACGERPAAPPPPGGVGCAPKARSRENL